MKYLSEFGPKKHEVMKCMAFSENKTEIMHHVFKKMQ
jgi:hypothetical protein